VNREKYQEHIDPEKAAAERARLPHSTDLLTPAQQAAERAEFNQRMAKYAAHTDPEETALRAAAERRKQALLKLGERELAWKSALDSAVRGSGAAKAKRDHLIAEYEARIRVVVAEDGGTPGLQRLIEEIEAAQQDNLNELTRVATAEAEAIAKAREISEQEEALRHAEGFSPAQALTWLQHRGFRLRQKKGQIEIAPAANLTKREQAMVRLHHKGLVGLLTAAEEWAAVA
jgi:hypothetical protein